MTRSATVDDGQSVEGKRATITQRHSANLFVTRSFEDRCGLGLGGNHVADRFPNPGKTVTLPDLVTVEALAWVKLGRARFRLNVFDPFDHRYNVSGHGNSPNLNLPGAPRTVWRVRFER